MSSEIELERLIVRLIADATGYTPVIQRAQADTETASKSICRSLDSISDDAEDVARRARQSFAQITDQLNDEIKGYTMTAEAMEDYRLKSQGMDADMRKIIATKRE